MGGVTVLIVLAVIAGICALSWPAVPKGDNQIVIRTSIVLTLTCCYLMWAITYMAQMHPLVSPKRSDIREGYAD